jgi:hypothetical protein
MLCAIIKHCEQNKLTSDENKLFVEY